MTDNDGPDEYPSEDELPDDPLAVDDIDPFEIDDSDFDDVNEFAAAEWVARTSAEERVRTVVRHLDGNAGVGDIAETALVSESETASILESIENRDREEQKSATELIREDRNRDKRKYDEKIEQSEQE